MNPIGSVSKKTRPFERILAIAGAGICLVVTVILSGSIGAQQNLWPLPGLYFIEMAVLSLVCALLAFVADNPLSHFITWVSVGIFTGFSILGAWSVGFFYLPVAVIFAVIGIILCLNSHVVLGGWILVLTLILALG